VLRRKIYSHGGGELVQKSRVLWLQEGDKCNRFFFHTMANSNKRRNSIDSLLIDDTISTN
jgi:hypothetical protein